MFRQNSIKYRILSWLSSSTRISSFKENHLHSVIPSFLSGKSSSELSIGLRKSNNIQIENIEVDETILKAGHHHGSTYYEHLELQKAITENLRSQVSLDDGLKAVAIGQAAELSIIEKRVVHMKEILED